MARRIDPSCIHNGPVVYDTIGIGVSKIVEAIENCYDTMDSLDETLRQSSTEPMSGLMELANLSSIMGNILGARIAANSAGLYARNAPNAYPDLIPQTDKVPEIEIKVALEQNKPKGHHPKPGVYLTFRYVLADKDGSFNRGKSGRGDTPWIYEARIGYLTEDDFSVSNTAGDSGKTATVRNDILKSMTRIIYVPELSPYSKDWQ